ncbi:antitoxin VbhA family protein [Bordetella bronchialis]|uniref:antitoxin VbhA family protein n=1 Tax=Bordetella bronchialis TaxID=463025 RepID=UPI003D0646AB
MLTEKEIAQRQHDARNALSSQRLEGLEPDARVIEQTRQYVAGEVELSDVIEEFVGRVNRGEVLSK